MFNFNDFIHLPELDAAIERIIAYTGPGLILVAGLDPRPGAAGAPGLPLPSGRGAIFNILLHNMLEKAPGAHAMYLTRDKASARPARTQRQRIRIEVIDPLLENRSYAFQVQAALKERPDLLVIDRITNETATLAAQAAADGLRVLSQIDSPLRAAALAGELHSLGAPPEHLISLAAVIAVQRLPTLCRECRQPAAFDSEAQDRLVGLYPQLAMDLDKCSPPAVLYQPGSCPRCKSLGRSGDIAAFDVYIAPPFAPSLGPRSLPFEEYLLGLVVSGYLPLSDLLELPAAEHRRTYALFSENERTLQASIHELNQAIARLSSAHAVLVERTRVLVGLETLSQHMVTSATLAELAMRICRSAAELCAADHVVLYVIPGPPEGNSLAENPEGSIQPSLFPVEMAPAPRPANENERPAEILALHGWNPAWLHTSVDQARIQSAKSDPKPFTGRPPGLPKTAMREAVLLGAGLAAPLISAGRQVGLMVVQSAHKSEFSKAEVAVLRTFANQAALAIQRAGLVDALRLKIVALENAQAELIKNERLERELELARQVQHSMLPHTFPEIPGYAFAARYQPARQVGGDFYDVIDLDEEYFGIVIADVSDKGFSSALYMALARSLIRAEARRERSPRRVLENVNRLLKDIEEAHKFLAVFYGVVEKSTRKLVYTRAGHDYPILLRSGQVQPLEGQGAVLGVMEPDELRLSEETLQLLDGDRLLLYTDGLSDVLNLQGQFFETSRLLDLFREQAAQSARQLIDSVFARLSAYQSGAEQFDDMTLLVVESTTK